MVAAMVPAAALLVAAGAALVLYWRWRWCCFV